MILKNTIVTVCLMLSFAGWAQVNFNDYKYIIVPKKFEGFYEENQYHTSTLIKYLFSEKGFTTVYDDKLPADLTSNRCLGLKVDLVDDSSMFTTKTILSLRDCLNKEIFFTQQGRSKVKDFKEAFKIAITSAFDSFTGVDYTYKEEVKSSEEPITISFKNDIKTMKEVPKDSKSQDNLVEQVATKDVQSYRDRTPVVSNLKKGNSTSNKRMVEQKSTKEEQQYRNQEPVVTDIKKESVVSTEKTIMGVLYAQEILNGFQLVDGTPKVQLKIFKSSMPNVYIAKSDNKDGVVYTSDGKWFFEYFEDDQVIQEELNIKF